MQRPIDLDPLMAVLGIADFEIVRSSSEQNGLICQPTSTKINIIKLETESCSYIYKPNEGCNEAFGARENQIL